MLREMVEHAKLEQVKQALELNRIKTQIVKNKEEARSLLESVITSDMVVCRGGSVTLDEMGLYNEINGVKLYNHNLSELSAEEKMACRYKGFEADVYLMSSNAITMNGELYNVDGSGNRVAALLFGPKQVYIIAGKNKIVDDLEAAKARVKEIAAPKNCVRLHATTPCVKKGTCMDCKSNGRICCDEVVVRWQMNPDRIHVILVEEELGY